MPKQPILLTDAIGPPALVRAGLDQLPAIVRAQGERASRPFIEFFAASIRNRNTRAAYARAVKSSSTGAKSVGWSCMTSKRSQWQLTWSSSARSCPNPRSSSTWLPAASSWITRSPGGVLEVKSGGLGPRSQIRGEARQDPGFVVRRGLPVCSIRLKALL